MGSVNIEEVIMDVVNSGELEKQGRDFSNNNISSYTEAANSLSQEIDSHDTTSLESILHDCSKRGSNSMPSSNVNPGGFLENSSSLDSGTQLGFQLPEEIELQGPSSGHPVTFTTTGQARRGSCHGKGGRTPGSGVQLRKYYSKYARSVLRKRMYDILTTSGSHHAGIEPVANDTGVRGETVASTHAPSAENERASLVCEKMVEELASRNDVPNWDITKYPCAAVKEKLLKELEQSASDEIPTSVCHLPSCILGVTARFTDSDSLPTRAGRNFNVRERHIVNTWLDRKGHVRCTCIGCTQYDILALNEEFHSPCCIHADAFVEVLQEVSQAVFGNCVFPFQVLYNSFAVVEPEIVDGDETQLPLFQDTHGTKSVIFICNDICGDNQLCWVPIRKIHRGNGRFLCAFCDMVNTNCCHHVTELRNLCEENLMAQPEDPPSDEEHGEAPAHTNFVDEMEETSISKNHHWKVQLPDCDGKSYLKTICRNVRAPNACGNRSAA